MQVTVFGASGKVGRLVVEILLQRGHTVRAVVHNHNPFAGMPGVEVSQININSAPAVEKTLAGSGAVICALGSWGTPTKDIVSTGMRTIIPAMQTVGLRRIVSLTGAEAVAPGEPMLPVQHLTHMAANVLAGSILRDGEKHIELLQKSSLDWTVIRSPIMNTMDSTEYHLELCWPKPWQTIHRQAVATALVDQLKDKTYLRKAPVIYR